MDREPHYARAHAGLADAYSVLGFYDFLPPQEAFVKAESAAKRALALDPSLARPARHARLYPPLLPLELGARRRRVPPVDRDGSRLFDCTPVVCEFLTAMGRFDDAEREMRRAQELDPLSLIANAALGWVFFYAGAFDKAIEQCRQTLELDANYALSMLWIGWSLEELGRAPEAVEQHRKAIDLTNGGAIYTTSLARAHAVGGNRAEALRVVAALDSRPARGQYVPPYEMARIHAALGDRDRAFEWLRARVRPAVALVGVLEVDPQLRSLQADPRFARLVKDVGL